MIRIQCRLLILYSTKLERVENISSHLNSAISKFPLMNVTVIKLPSPRNAGVSNILASLLGVQIFSSCVAEAQDTIASGENITTYIDNNFIHPKTFKEYVTILEQLFTALRKFGMKLNPVNYTFLVKETKCFGHVVNDKGFKYNL